MRRKRGEDGGRQRSVLSRNWRSDKIWMFYPTAAASRIMEGYVPAEQKPHNR